LLELALKIQENALSLPRVRFLFWDFNGFMRCPWLYPSANALIHLCLTASE